MQGVRALQMYFGTSKAWQRSRFGALHCKRLQGAGYARRPGLQMYFGTSKARQRGRFGAL